MVSSTVHEVAQEMPEHQTSRGAEFRNLSVEDRYGMARQIVIGRSQANATNADFDNDTFRYHMRKKKEAYMYYAGRLGIDHDEARYIWRSIVYEGVDYPLHGRQGRV